MNMYSLIHENLKDVFQLKLCQTAVNVDHMIFSLILTSFFESAPKQI